MKYKIKGTMKQKLAVVEVIKNGGNVGAAMRKVGYSSNTAKTPQKLTESDGFHLLTQEYFPDRRLVELTAQGLEAVKFYEIPNENPLIYPDWLTRHKYLELAYKLKKML